MKHYEKLAEEYFKSRLSSGSEESEKGFIAGYQAAMQELQSKEAGEVSDAHEEIYCYSLGSVGWAIWLDREAK